MWGILTDMVATRRSSARLQKKLEEEEEGATASGSAVSDSGADGNSGSERGASTTTRASPPRRAARGRGSAKAASPSPSPSASASPSAQVVSDGAAARMTATTPPKTRRESPRKVQQQTEEAATSAGKCGRDTHDTASTTESDPDMSVKQEQIEETAGQTAREEPAITSETEAPVTVAPGAVKAGEEEQEEEEEEAQILMMEDTEDEEEDTHEEGEQDPDDDTDIIAFATMAASGIDLSGTSKPASVSTTTTTSSVANLQLVPDVLDSGAASRTQYLEFAGSKLALGAKLVGETVASEEKKGMAAQLNKLARSNRQRTEAKDTSSAGRQWFDMTSHELTADVRRDFALLRMRNYLDPKKFYKSSDHTKKQPQHFQLGTVIEGAHEFKSSRMVKKDRQQTFTDEIMADDGIRAYTKRVFTQINDARAGHGKRKKKHARTRR